MDHNGSVRGCDGAGDQLEEARIAWVSLDPGERSIDSENHADIFSSEDDEDDEDDVNEDTAEASGEWLAMRICCVSLLWRYEGR